MVLVRRINFLILGVKWLKEFVIFVLKSWKYFRKLYNVSLPVSVEKFLFMALFNSMRTLKFKARLTIAFYTAVNPYCNGHAKAETSKKLD